MNIRNNCESACGRNGSKAKAKRNMIDVYKHQRKEQFKRALAYSLLKDSQLFKDVRKDVHKLHTRKLSTREAFKRALKCNKTLRTIIDLKGIQNPLTMTNPLTMKKTVLLQYC